MTTLRPLRGLRYARRMREITQAEMADRLDMTQPQYSKIETGETDPRLSTMVRIAFCLGVKLDELL